MKSIVPRANGTPSYPANTKAEWNAFKSTRIWQPKRIVGEMTDPLESEADRIADRVSTGGAAFGPSGAGGVLQRKCASCENEEEEAVRRAAPPGAASPSTAPASVEAVLSAGGGKPLDPALRSYVEPRFGFDFGRVRIHDDARAHVSAEDVSARAYTSGSTIVFGRGQYAPHTREGMHLLAHELAHVVQQTGGATAVIRRQPRAERSHTVGQDETLYAIARRYGVSVRDITALNDLAGTTIRPGQMLRIPPAPTRSQSAEPQPSPSTQAPPQPTQGQPAQPQPAQSATATNWAGRALSPETRESLAQFLFHDIGVTPGNTTGAVTGSRFLLHDTSGASSRATLEANARDARGPLGSGPNVFIPQTGLEILQRPDFFDPRRPTTTESEKGTDIMDEPHRNAALRAVWNATNAVQRTAALSRALAGLPLSPAEVTSETTSATAQLNATSGRVFTTATWAVEQICTEVGRSGAAAVAATGREADLTTACAAVQPLLAARRLRIGSTVSVELVQEGTRGRNQNSCDPRNPDLIPLPDPPYSGSQYSNTAMMYLRAAVMAGSFPEITTHFVVDAFTRGHCDPRCFNLDQLYRTIAGTLAPLGHAANSLYGVTPSYGMRSGTNSVWWDNSICHGPAPR